MTPISGTVPFAVLGTTGYFVEDGRFVVADLTDPAEPQRLWQSRRLRPGASGITIEGRRAYVVEADQLLIWDVAKPLEPVEVGSWPHHDAFKIVVEGRTIYFLERAKGGLLVRTVNAFRPDAPVEKSAVAFPWTDFVEYHVDYDDAYFLVHDGRLYMLGEGRVWIADLSQPAAPLTTLDAPAGITSHLTASVDRLFVGSERGVYAYDLTSDPPALIGPASDNLSHKTYAVGHRLFLWWQVCGWEPTEDGGISGGCGYGVDVIDLAEPAQPHGYKRISIAPMGSDGDLLPEGPPWIEGTALFGSLFYLYTADYTVEQGWVPDTVWVLDLSPFMPGPSALAPSHLGGASAEQG